MAHEITGTRTVARLHAVVAVEAFRTHLVAAISHPTGKADALTIILPAFGVVLAATLLATVRSVESVRAHRLTVGPGPSRRALAHSRFMRTFATVLAGTLQTALRPVRIRGTGMFTRRSNVTRPAGVLSGYVIAGGVAVHGPGTAFLATVTEESIRTGLVTVRTGPAT